MLNIQAAKNQLVLATLALFATVVTTCAQAQTNWDQIHQQNWEHQQRIEAQNRQQQENQENYTRQLEQQAEQDAQNSQNQNQQNEQSDQGSQQNYQAPQAGWVDSYLSMAMTARHGAAWVAVNFDSKARADEASLAACQAAVKEVPCFIAFGVTNGYVANAMAGNGAILADWGATAAEAQAKVNAQCEGPGMRCEPMHTYSSPAWRSDRRPSDFERVISPTLTPEMEYRFAVVVWTTGEDVWAKSAWAASGHSTLEAAEAVAMDRCKQDAGDQCKRATHVSSGFIAIGQDDNGMLRTSVSQSNSGAEQGLMARCKTDQRRCTLIRVVAASESAARRIQLPRPWIGLTYNEVNASLAKELGFDSPRGALITEVTANGPAAAAGLQVGDVVLRYDGKPIIESGQFAGIIGQSKSGTALAVETIHFGKAKTITVTPVEFGGTQ